jgi:23S rRNA pseudouridine2604 synthase
VRIDGVMTKPAHIQVVKDNGNNTWLEFIISEGKNRQIRRMCEVFGFDVVKLERIRIMNVSLKGLAPGDWRDLTEKEVETILSLTEHSSSEAQQPLRRSTRNKASSGKPGSRKRGSPRSGEGGKLSARKTASQKAGGKTPPDKARSDRATPPGKASRSQKPGAKPTKRTHPKGGVPSRKPRGRK